MHSNTNRLSLGWFTIKNDVDISFFIYDLLQNKEIDQMRNDFLNPSGVEMDPSSPCLESDSAKILYDLLLRILQHCKEHTLKIQIIPHYDDRYYRSSYSLYYYAKHFQYSNWCKRLFLFDGGNLTPIEKETYRPNREVFGNNFIGSIVIRPIQGMEIGRTLIDPSYIYGNNHCEQYAVRTAYYSETMLGIRMHVYAFPFSMQDGETATCAETTILNISDYFSQRYQSYRSVFPTEVSQIAHSNSFDRNLPSKGLSYQKLSKILMEVGFYPRLYATRFERERILDILYCYVSSGIPVAMGINQGRSNAIGHSVVVVGVAGDIFRNRDNKILSRNDLCVERIPNQQLNTTTFVSLLGNDANKKNKYYIMDDGRAPYSVCEIQMETKWEKGLTGDIHQVTMKYAANPYDCTDTEYTRKITVDRDDDGNVSYVSIGLPDAIKQSKFNINFLTVPLSKEMAMEAENAIRCFKNLLGRLGVQNQVGYTAYVNNLLSVNDDNLSDLSKRILPAGDSNENPLLMRVFLCASRSLKKHRYDDLCSCGENAWLTLYRQIHMPRFVWVCELYTLESIQTPSEPLCVGEIVLDATTANSHVSDLSNVIIINYPWKITYRLPYENEGVLIERLKESDTVFTGSDSAQWRPLKPFRFGDKRLKTEEQDDCSN